MRYLGQCALALLIPIALIAAPERADATATFVDSSHSLSAEATVGLSDQDSVNGNGMSDVLESVNVFAQFTSTQTRTTATGDAELEASLLASPNVLAVQSSAVATIGTDMGTSTAASAAAESNFDITFEVDVPTAYEVMGSLSTSFDTSVAQITQMSFQQTLRLADSGDQTIFERMLIDFPEVALLPLLGVLEPGTYTLTVSSLASVAGLGQRASAEARSDFSVVFRNVPEPATGLLLGLCLLGAIYGERRSNR